MNSRSSRLWVCGPDYGNLSQKVLDKEGTKREHSRRKRELPIMWFKDVLAGLGLVLFVASSFVLTGAVQASLFA